MRGKDENKKQESTFHTIQMIAQHSLSNQHLPTLIKNRKDLQDFQAQVLADGFPIRPSFPRVYSPPYFHNDGRSRLYIEAALCPIMSISDPLISSNKLGGGKGERTYLNPSRRVNNHCLRSVPSTQHPAMIAGQVRLRVRQRSLTFSGDRMLYLLDRHAQ
jgi:hypothetical protein